MPIKDEKSSQEKGLGLGHKRFGVDSSQLVIGFKDMSVVEMAKTVLCWNVFEDGNWGADVRAEVY